MLDSLKVSLLVRTVGLSSFGDARVEYGADLITTRAYIPSLNLEVPIIPGTQIKGILRTIASLIHDVLAERNIISWNVEAFRVCRGSLKNPCHKCLVCTIFGSPGSPQAPLHVSNFYPVREDRVEEVMKEGLVNALRNPNYWYIPKTIFISRIRIDDSSGTVYPGALYTYEHLYPGTLFYGEVTIHRNLLANVVGVENLDRVYVESSILILASIAQLNYTSIGRNSLCLCRVLSIEPENLRQNRYVELILRGLEEAEEI